MYYYFVDNIILEIEDEINVTLNPAYTPLTEEQKQFYLEHPKAAIFEVKNCQLVQNITANEITLSEVKKDTKNEISEISLNALKKVVKDYQLSNAQISLSVLSDDPEADTIYDHEKATEVIENYNAYGTQFRNLYYAASEEIDIADNIADVLKIKDRYCNSYLNILIDDGIISNDSTIDNLMVN